MTRDKWKEKIVEACDKAGTYQPYFDDVIETLSGIMETRDDVELKFKKTGGEPVITHTNKGGASNPAKNPYLVLLGELNRDALAYWRDLGLTPSGYKKINEKLESKSKSGFGELLAKIDV